MLLLEQDMSANTLCVMGSIPIRVVIPGSSVGRATENPWVRIPLRSRSDSQVVKAKHQGCLIQKKSTTSLKNGEQKLKPALFARELFHDPLPWRGHGKANSQVITSRMMQI